MNYNKTLTAIALTATLAACQSNDEIVSPQDATRETQVRLGYNTSAQGSSRAATADIPQGNADFAADQEQDLRIFLQENASASVKATYSPTGYLYTAKNLTLTLQEGMDHPLWASRSDNTHISCYAFYVYGGIGGEVVNPNSFLASTGDESTTRGDGNDFAALETYIQDHVEREGDDVELNLHLADFTGFNTQYRTVANVQSTGDAYRMSDILVAHPEGRTDFTMNRPAPGGANKLTFMHAGNKITLKLVKGEATDGIDFTQAKVELLNFSHLGAINPKPYNGVSGSFLALMPYVGNGSTVTDAAGTTHTLASGVKHSVGQSITMIDPTHKSNPTRMGDDLSCSAIVPVQDITAVNGFLITLNGKQLTWYVGNNPDISTPIACKAGVEYRFTLTVDNGRLLKLTNYEMTDWTTFDYEGKIDNVDL